MANDFLTDQDPIETREWLESLQSVIEVEGPARAQYLLEQLLAYAQQQGSTVVSTAVTPYINTIPANQEAKMPGDKEIQERVGNIIRWNAVAMVLNAGKYAPELGGHIASYASSAWLYEVGFNHFFRANNKDHNGDLLYIQGHVTPGIYARSFLEGRLTEEQLMKFRQEIDTDGLSSYPHPWLMPDYWQFPTVSMGLGPIQSIYQARFMKYLTLRGLVDCSDRKVWCFCGDGEMDEPESLGALNIAVKEKLDNLIFVINCNLQRLDGPVRGNGKIIQELEGIFSGSGWNVIKVLWGERWEALLAKDTSGLLMQRMSEVVDGEYQNYKANGGAYTREHFFGKYPELLELVSDLSDEDIAHLIYGGHDPQKVYAAYHSAMNKDNGRPTVILVKTVKGYGMGLAGEAQNITHQQKKMDMEALKVFRDRFKIPLTDKQLEGHEKGNCPFYTPPAHSPEIEYLHERRKELGGYLPARNVNKETLLIPSLSTFAPLLEATGEERHISTTMAFVRFLNILLKDKTLGPRIVPIIPDEARTFGMEGMFRQLGIYSVVGQLYEPMDRAQVMYYREDQKGQILEEGITEAGAMSSWIAAATSYAIHNYTMLPFYIFYSMFGFQRIGDLAWAAGDSQARGFLLGGTAGRTTLAGEGLQHQDGHSLVLSSTVPNCISYDPAFSYELAVIMHDGLRRMYEKQENVFYYITVMNENYSHPAMPEGAEEGILKGIYLFKKGKAKSKLPTVQLLGAGTILREVIEAADILAKDYGVNSDIWSVTSFNELRRDGIDVERWNRFHPTAKPRTAYVTKCFEKCKGPIVAATDYMRIYAEQIRPHITQHYITLGTDGFGRSDTRKQLRHFFEVDKRYVVVAALKALADEGAVPAKTVADAIKKLGIDPEKPNPVTV